MKTIEMELALSTYFSPRQNLVIPNVSWGFGLHECDLIVLTKAKYLYEIEIKVSKADLIKDKEKKHQHKSDKIRKLYFAIPEGLQEHTEHIPERAGIIIVGLYSNGRKWCRKIREAKVNPKAPKMTIEDCYKLARLGSLRIWSLKTKIFRLTKKVKPTKRKRKKKY